MHLLQQHHRRLASADERLPVTCTITMWTYVVGCTDQWSAESHDLAARFSAAAGVQVIGDGDRLHWVHGHAHAKLQSELGYCADDLSELLPSVREHQLLGVPTDDVHDCHAKRAFARRGRAVSHLNCMREPSMLEVRFGCRRELGQGQRREICQLVLLSQRSQFRYTLCRG